MISFSGELVLLDVEGTVSPLSYVHDVLFPFARNAVTAVLERHQDDPEVQAALERMAIDAGHKEFATWCPHAYGAPEACRWVADEVHRLMDADVKATGLKLLQGLIWEEGFTSGVLRAQLYPDVAPAFRVWHSSGRELRIYSSGSVQAQILFFRHSNAGDLTSMLSGYHDTTTGPKREARSYHAIAGAAGRAPDSILFLSDVVEELDAARTAGLRTGLARRPGNRETGPTPHPAFSTLADINVA